MDRQYFVYIMTNMRKTTLYTGITSDLKRRACEHKEKLAEGFSKRYRLSRLVYYEMFDRAEDAILREKQIKAGSRQKKVELVNTMNNRWRDLYEEL